MYKLMSECVPNLVIAECNKLEKLLSSKPLVDYVDSVYEYILIYGGEIQDDSGQLISYSNVKTNHCLASTGCISIDITDNHKLFVTDWKTLAFFGTYDLYHAFNVFNKLCKFHGYKFL